LTYHNYAPSLFPPGLTCSGETNTAPHQPPTPFWTWSPMLPSNLLFAQLHRGPTEMSWSITLELPADATSSTDVVANYRSSVGRAMRRGLEKVAGYAITPYLRVNNAYRVTQETGGGSGGG